MNWTTELPFRLDGVDGELKIVYNPLSQKLYQNGMEVRKSGSGFGGLKYNVRTTDGGTDVLKVKAALKSGRQVIFRGVTTNLEKSLSVLSILLSTMPFFFIAFFIIIIGGAFGALGGALLGGCGALGMLAIGNLMRSGSDNLGLQIVYSLIISSITTALYFVLALIFGLIFSIFFGGAMLLL
jgi:hypothetical protein